MLPGRGIIRAENPVADDVVVLVVADAAVDRGDVGAAAVAVDIQPLPELSERRPVRRIVIETVDGVRISDGRAIGFGSVRMAVEGFIDAGEEENIRRPFVDVIFLAGGIRGFRFGWSPKFVILTSALIIYDSGRVSRQNPFVCLSSLQWNTL